MRYELRLHRLAFGILAVLLMAFIAFLIVLHPLFADRRWDVITSFIIIVLAATAFGSMGMIEGMIALYFGKHHKRELLSYLALGLLSLGCSIYLTVADSASIHTVALVAAPHAFLFGIAELRLGQHLRRHASYKRGILVAGIVEIALGIALIGAYRLSDEGVSMLLGYVATISVLQLLPLVSYWRKPYIGKNAARATSSGG